MKREFKGVWIHKDIWLAESLSLQEKVFLAEIDSLDNEDGCFANNEYFAKFFGISKVRVSEVINSLVAKGYITSSIKQEEGNKRILNSLAKFSLRPSQNKDEYSHQLSFKHSNTISNTSINPINNQGDISVWPSFDNFWDRYDKKADRPKCEKKWAKIKQGEREKIMMHLDVYIPSTPDKQFRKNPLTYLNSNSWENEIILSNGNSKDKFDPRAAISNIFGTGG